MFKVIKLKKGLDIKLVGEAEKKIINTISCDYYASKPTDFRALTPKLMVKAGDPVKAGDTLYIDKYRPQICFTSPVSGTVEAVNRGERRKVLEIVIKADKKNSYKEFNVKELSALKREEIVELLLQSGLWPMLKQRPYDIIANPEQTPGAIFVSGFDSAPLAPDYDVLLQGEEKALQAGIYCLNKLVGKPVNLNLRHNDNSNHIFKKLKDVEVNYFSGPHPAGNPGIQIHHLKPISKGDIIWVVNPVDVMLIGRFMMTGHTNLEKIVTLTGSEVKEPAYYKVIAGAKIDIIVNGKLKNKVNQRIISGNVLTGKKVKPENFLSFYDSVITVIPEGDNYEFLGWASPGFKKFSMSKTFPSFLCPNKKYSLDANYHGEQRAYVVTGQYEKVLPMDILPVYLIKAVLAKDLDKMEQLGMYEIAPEDMALCEFVCTSKIPVQAILDDGIQLMIKELS